VTQNHKESKCRSGVLHANTRSETHHMIHRVCHLLRVQI